ncbi:uncharacterized protein LOC130015297 [Mercurialis annua]|uniref:uncharacterized protein LOC130015297 n=1 Tax=Mercurialis annua TaxID=3986 RepID=UPI0024ADEFA7|nr:uncharacterized protein LOC130015297 [Mercurialis annua]
MSAFENKTNNVNNNIQSRIQTRPSTYPRCYDVEDVNHLLLKCPFAEAGWLGSTFSHIIAATENEAGVLLQKAAWTAWAIWLSRNMMIFREDIEKINLYSLMEESRLQDYCFVVTVLEDAGDPLLTLQIADNLFRECINALSEKNAETRAIQTLPRWSPSPANTLKINFDGAFHKASGTGVGAAVV